MEILKDSELGELYEEAYEKACKQTRENDTYRLADYFIEESKGALTWEEALEKARRVFSRKVASPTAS